MRMTSQKFPLQWCIIVISHGNLLKMCFLVNMYSILLHRKVATYGCHFWCWFHTHFWTRQVPVQGSTNLSWLRRSSKSSKTSLASSSNFPWTSRQPMMTMNNSFLLSLKSWLFNRDPYNGLLQSVYNIVQLGSISSPTYPKQHMTQRTVNCWSGALEARCSVRPW